MARRRIRALARRAVSAAQPVATRVVSVVRRGAPYARRASARFRPSAEAAGWGALGGLGAELAVSMLPGSWSLEAQTLAGAAGAVALGALGAPASAVAGASGALAARWFRAYRSRRASDGPFPAAQGQRK